MNSYVTLPAPAGIGAGAAVDVSLMAATKTVGSIQSAGTVVVIEVALDAGGTKWAPIFSFNNTGQTTLQVASHWMRARVIAFPTGGSAPDVSVGAPDATAQFVTLVAPAGNADGAAVDVTAMDAFKTIQVSGAFEGVLSIFISEDGVDYAKLCQFTSAGEQSLIVVPKFMRVHRAGVTNTSATPPTVLVASAPIGTGGGGGGSGTEQNYVYTITGAEVGFGTANVTIPLQHPKPSTAYIAIAVDGGRVDTTLVMYSTPVAQYTLTTFQVAATQIPAIGDKIVVSIADITP